MYILSGSLTSFVCAPNSAHPRPRSARPRLAEPSPHFGGAVGKTARTPHRRDWTDHDDWQRLGRRDWLPFRPPAQRGSAPAAPPPFPVPPLHHSPPPTPHRAAPPPRSCTCKTSCGARRGAPAAPPPLHPHTHTPHRQRAAAGSGCRSPPLHRRWTGRPARRRCAAVFTFAGLRDFSPCLGATHAWGCCRALRSVSFSFLSPPPIHP